MPIIISMLLLLLTTSSKIAKGDHKKEKEMEDQEEVDMHNSIHTGAGRDIKLMWDEGY